MESFDHNTSKNSLSPSHNLDIHLSFSSNYNGYAICEHFKCSKNVCLRENPQEAKQHPSKLQGKTVNVLNHNSWLEKRLLSQTCNLKNRHKYWKVFQSYTTSSKVKHYKGLFPLISKSFFIMWNMSFNTTYTVHRPNAQIIILGAVIQGAHWHLYDTHIKQPLFPGIFSRFVQSMYLNKDVVNMTAHSRGVLSKKVWTN